MARSLVNPPKTAKEKAAEAKEKALQKSLNKFTSAVAKREGGKSQERIGNIRESARIMNDLLGGKLYKLILQAYPTDVKNAD